MKIKEIENELEKNNIPKTAYSIEKMEDETLCILKKNKIFEVFYYERGLRNSLKKFIDEEAACYYFFEELKSWFKK